jgi:hypothetical protein
LPKKALYTLGIGTGSPQTEAELDRLKKGVEKWLETARKHGYDEVYIYGIDEAKGEKLKIQRAAWRKVHEAGGKVFAACSADAINLVGDLLDLAILSGKPRPDQAEEYHKMGGQVFCYGNPQVGVEQPETYRRNFGLVVWKAGYDGAMDYAYQHSYSNIWNDFDNKRYRDHVFAYPVAHGVIDTIEWEGFREGVDDVRYLSTLLEEIKRVRSRTPELAARAEKWALKIHPDMDLDEVREQIIDWIIKLNSVSAPDTKHH